MGEDRLPRKLAAIFYADVVGYSRLTGEDEEGTRRQLKSHFEVVSASIKTYGGTVVKYAGDAVLAQFPTVTDALASAADVQQALAERNRDLPEERKIQFRIGVNLGEVIVDGDDIHGDGVNVAARLEGLAEPGGICISESVKSAVGKKLPVEFQSLGEQQVKNIADPVRAYHVRLRAGANLPEPTGIAKPQKTSRVRMSLGAAVIAVVIGAAMLVWLKPWAPEIEPAPHDQIALPLTEKLSIAVLPFNNVSGDSAQEYFSDGISEDIITDLSRVSGLKVIDRNSSFTYKGKAVKLQQVGKDLGVQYVLQGSIRKAGRRVRITTQLAKTTDGYQLWAERYDREQGDIFALQDEITEKIISALLIKLSGDEKNQLTSRPTRNFEAYDLFLRGQQHFRAANKEDNLLAQELYRQAIELDSGFGRAYGAYAVALAFNFARGWSDRPGETLDRALELAQRAIQLNEFLPQTHWALGYTYMQRKEWDRALAAVQHAVTLVPNFADGYGLLALINNRLSRADEAIELIRKAMRLNPYYTWDYPYNLGRAYYTKGQYGKAVDYLHQALERNEAVTYPRLFLAASYVELGQTEDAAWEIIQLQMTNPDMRLSHLASAHQIVDEVLMQRFLTDLREAGLPE